MDIYENAGKSYSYEEAKKRAKEFYKTIGVIWCPTLNTDIFFTREGFDHLIGKRGILRPKSEQRRRFDLLLLAKEILTDPAARFTCEKKLIIYRTKINGAYTTIHATAHFWIFQKEYGVKIVTLVIKQIDDHPKHFLSIFERTRKAAQ
jgi:hypothetical protein